MARNKIQDLRDHLFETIEALRDPDKPMDLDRARAISEVAQTIINSAKVEVDLVKATGASGAGSAFFPVREDGKPIDPRAVLQSGKNAAEVRQIQDADANPFLNARKGRA